MQVQITCPMMFPLLVICALRRYFTMYTKRFSLNLKKSKHSQFHCSTLCVIGFNCYIYCMHLQFLLHYCTNILCTVNRGRQNIALHHFQTRFPAVWGLTWNFQPWCCFCAAMNFLCFQTELHSSSALWMTCPQALHPFISWLKVKAQAQKTLWIQYHTVNKSARTNNQKPSYKSKYIEQKLRDKYRAWSTEALCLLGTVTVWINAGTIAELSCSFFSVFGHLPLSRTNLGSLQDKDNKETCPY